VLQCLGEGDTTSQPQKGACGQNSTAPVVPSWRHLAVGPTPPADWGTRSTRSHLGKRPEVPDFCPHGGVGPGVRPVLGQVSPEAAGTQGGLGPSRFLAGFRPAAPCLEPAGGGGGAKERAHGGKKVASRSKSGGPFQKSYIRSWWFAPP
jgi:hypothetical protein